MSSRGVPKSAANCSTRRKACSEDLDGEAVIQRLRLAPVPGYPPVKQHRRRYKPFQVYLLTVDQGDRREYENRVRRRRTGGPVLRYFRKVTQSGSRYHGRRTKSSWSDIRMGSYVLRSTIGQSLQQ